MNWLHEAIALWSWSSWATVLTSGLVLGWTISTIRRAIDPEAFLWSATTLALLWFVPLTVQRFSEPELLPVALRTIGTGVQFEAFVVLAYLVVAYRRRHP